MAEKYLVRPDDFAVFSRNENGTYSIDASKKLFPNSLHHEYTEEQLKRFGFFVGKEEDFNTYKDTQDAYYSNKSLNNQSRYDDD